MEVNIGKGRACAPSGCARGHRPRDARLPELGGCGHGVARERIRLDRLGRDQNHLMVNSVVIYSKESIEEQLFEIWNRGLDIFQRSLSGLEIITGELNERIEEALLDDIYNGLESCSA